MYQTGYVHPPRAVLGLGALRGQSGRIHPSSTFTPAPSALLCVRLSAPGPPAPPFIAFVLWCYVYLPGKVELVLTRWLSDKESTCNARDTGDAGLFPVSGRSHGEGYGNSLQHSCLVNPMDRGSWWATVHGVFLARILEWVAMPSSRGSSQPRDQTRVSSISCTGKRILYHCTTGEALVTY